MENLSLPITELLTVSLLTECFVQIAKGIATQKLSEQGKQIVAMLISITLCMLLQISIFVDMPLYGILLGNILAGIIASRGSNFIHDLISGVNAIRLK